MSRCQTVTDPGPRNRISTAQLIGDFFELLDEIFEAVEPEVRAVPVVEYLDELAVALVHQHDLVVAVVMFHNELSPVIKRLRFHCLPTFADI
jgi:hypothetical protein